MIKNCCPLTTIIKISENIGEIDDNSEIIYLKELKLI